MVVDNIVASGSSVNGNVGQKNDQACTSNLQNPKPVKPRKNRTKKNSPKPKVCNKKKPEKKEYKWRRFPSNPKKAKLNRFIFNSNNTGPAVPDDLKSPLEFFSLFFTDELIETIVTETNRYAEETIIRNICDEKILPSSRLNTWTKVTSDEIKVFFGIFIWMGLDQKPSMSRYWSTLDLY